LHLAMAYMRERKQFGKRLFDHQALRHRIVDRWAEVEAAAALLERACQSARGNYLPHHEVAAVKLVAARSCGGAIDEALQIFGARGFTDAYPIERMYRDARLTRIGGGTDEVLREIVALYLDAEHPRQPAGNGPHE
jgi:alkylation response protein AidB-like acyl-CoA dehydrogenase